MCGIVGFVGNSEARTHLVNGLQRLAYRGYDSAGHVFLNGNGFELFRGVGSPEEVARKVERQKPTASMGLSHTRWATHGGVSEENTHPHVSYCGRFAIVHNGVVENFSQLRKLLAQHGITFKSQTDTEVLCNLIAHNYEQEDMEPGRARLLSALRKSFSEVKGSFGIGLVCIDCPGELFAARNSSSLIIGIGDGEHFLASDAAAFNGRTNRAVYLEDGQIACLRADDFDLLSVTDEIIEPFISELDHSEVENDLGDFSHFMLKEIYEQPAALENALRGRIDTEAATAKLGGLNIDARELRQVDRILLLACGTAWHACLVAEYMIEKYARIPVDVEYASELRYRNAPIDKNTLVFVISQSGETVDTLEAMREMRRKGMRCLAITNGVGSAIAREADGGIYQHAGPEVGVASTKAFTSQVTIAALLSLYFGRMRDLSFEGGSEIIEAFNKLPQQINTILGQNDYIAQIAEKYVESRDFLFLGRQSMFPIALEGALKLKEISYIHAEGYPAAEMKHGPIALISEECPSVIIAPKNSMYAKTRSNIEEIRARRGPVIAITTEGSDLTADEVDDLILIPEAHDIATPILATIPLQLLSYHIAVKKGCNVDRPRNLAKSVTVE